MLKFDEAIKIMNEIKELTYLDARLMDWKYHNEAVDIAISSIEKQMPKKVIEVKTKQTTIHQCSLCKRDVFSSIDKYCAICGQKLDWD